MTPFDRLVTGPPDISIEEAERRMFGRRVEKLPLVAADRKIRGLITKKDILAARQRPYSSKDARGRLLVGAAIGARGDFPRARRRAARRGRGRAPDRHRSRALGGHAARGGGGPGPLPETSVSCAATSPRPRAPRFLRDLGADAIKVGVGPGRGCRTRLETGAGVPQLQAIREAWCAVEETVPIIADGGVREDKDVFLALVAGASVVMLGSLLSGTDEAPGQIIEDPGTGEKRKIYRGMTSPQAVFRALYDDEEPDALETRPRGAGGGPGDAGAVSRARWWTSCGGSVGTCALPSATVAPASLAQLRGKVLPDPSGTWSRCRRPPAPNPTSAKLGQPWTS